MRISLGQNISSLRIQRQSTAATEGVYSAFERLSSGQRINRASDDAAGLALSTGLRADTKIFTQGMRNLSDGVSLLRIAEGAVGEMSSIVTRIEELASQAANGVYGVAQRAAINLEAVALQSEFNRVRESTSYNGMKVFSALGGGIVIQGGGNARSLEVKTGVGVGTVPVLNSVTLVSTNSSGTIANNASRQVHATPDGRYLVFSSDATNLVPGDTNGRTDVFMKDMQSGVVSRLSTNSSGTQGNNISTDPKITADGRYVTFSSVASNLVAGDTNGATDVFLRDTLTNTTTRVSTNSSGTQANDSSNNSSITPDGRYLLFDSHATNLVAGDTNGVPDLFRKDLQTGTVTRVNTSSSGTAANATVTNSSISDDGRYVLFDSSASNLVGDDTNSLSDVFLKDMQTGTTTRISTSSSGGQANGMSGTPYISGNGRFASFHSTASNIVTGDVNSFDVFMKDLQTGVTTRANSSTTGVQGNNMAMWLDLK